MNHQDTKGTKKSKAIAVELLGALGGESAFHFL
jgi:hypothetical protein